VERGFDLRANCGAAGGGLRFANDRPERKLGHNRVNPKKDGGNGVCFEAKRKEPNSDRFRRLKKDNPFVTVLERREGGANLKAPEACGGFE
jgi:hypothetical protein